MTETEKYVISQVLEFYFDKTTMNHRIVPSYNAFVKYWKDKNFTDNFDAVMKKYLKPNEIEVLYRRSEGLTFREIAEEFHVSQEAVQQLFLKGVGKLAYNGQAVKDLYYGIRRYAEASKDGEEVIDLKNSGLSKRATNVMVRNFDSDMITVQELKSRVNLTNLAKIKNCGAKTAAEIIAFAKSFGVNTSKWEYQLSNMER